MLEHNSMTIIKPKYVKRGEPVVFNAECPVHEKAAWYIMRVNVKGKGEYRVYCASCARDRRP